MRKGWSAVAVTWLLIATSQIRADVLISETISGQAGDIKNEGTRITMIKGMKMRVETKQAKGSLVLVTIYDAAAGERIILNSDKRKAEITKFEELQKAAEKEVPKKSVNSTIAPTGRREMILGQSCEEYQYAIRVPMLKSGDPLLVMTGTAYVAKDISCAKEYGDFVSAADRGGLILGLTSGNLVVVSLARAQTELHRILAGLGGIPVAMESKIDFEGGFFAHLFDKFAGSGRSSRATQISWDPLPDENFEIPAGWKFSNK